jgi:hypothetical protein
MKSKNYKYKSKRRISKRRKRKSQRKSKSQSQSKSHSKSKSQRKSKKQIKNNYKRLTRLGKKWAKQMEIYMKLIEDQG